MNFVVWVGSEGWWYSCVSIVTHTPPFRFTQCDVVRAGFKENITLTLDGQTGHLIR